MSDKSLTDLLDGVLAEPPDIDSLSREQLVRAIRVLAAGLTEMTALHDALIRMASSSPSDEAPARAMEYQRGRVDAFHEMFSSRGANVEHSVPASAWDVMAKDIAQWKGRTTKAEARVARLELELAVASAVVRADEREACAREVESLRWPEAELDEDRARLNDAFSTAAECIRARGRS